MEKELNNLDNCDRESVNTVKFLEIHLFRIAFFLERVEIPSAAKYIKLPQTPELTSLLPGGFKDDASDVPFLAVMIHLNRFEVDISS